ncbi:helix-turn-helix transcriptional regulator [Tateyamaria sp.]|uniref:helix-turn-helix transcriptional regulator n=1 Tax=Tateyamaria sp. TaxID=1929288 RepID=UPI00329E2E4B
MNQTFPMKDGQLDELLLKLENITPSIKDWQNVCDLLARCAGGVGTVILSVEPSPRAKGITGSASMHKAGQAYIAEDWFRADPRQGTALHMLEFGYAIDRDLGEISTLLKLPFYSEFLPRFDLGGFCGLHFKVDEEDWCASIQFGLNRYEPRDGFIEKLPIIRAALSEAASKTKADGVSAWREVWRASQTFDAVLIPIDQTAAIVPELIEQNSNLPDWFGSYADFSALLESMPTTVVDWLNGNMGFPLMPFNCRLKSKSYASCTFYNAPDFLDFFPFRVAGLVSVSRIHTPMRFGSVFAKKYKLSPAEFQIVEQLCEGRNIREIAEKKGLKDGTVRQQLKSVFSKTGTSSQHQLVVSVYQME